jgi:hypothetical protein
MQARRLSRVLRALLHQRPLRTLRMSLRERSLRLRAMMLRRVSLLGLLRYMDIMLTYYQGPTSESKDTAKSNESEHSQESGKSSKLAKVKESVKKHLHHSSK